MSVRTRIWKPSGLRRQDLSSLAYVVLDELDAGLAGLTVSPWPTVDASGRLRFDLERSRSVGVDESELMRFLREHRTPSKYADRPLRIGDVFATQIRELVIDGGFAEPADWMAPPVSDVSRQAREASKVTYLAAAATIVSPRTALREPPLPSTRPLRAVLAGQSPDPFEELR